MRPSLGLKQLRIAETEKYAHVTFFLNGGREEPFAGEDRIMVQSPKVATYDLKPEMSALEVTDKLEAAIGSGKYDLIVVNYANPDMVGHTGFLPAAEKAVTTIDQCLGRLRAAVEKAGGVLLITADHGNVEMMRDPETGEPHTAHTTFDVPIIVVNGPREPEACPGPARRCCAHASRFDGTREASGNGGPFAGRRRENVCGACGLSGFLSRAVLLGAAAIIPLAAAAVPAKHVRHHPQNAQSPATAAAPDSDLSGAMPAAAVTGMPSTTDQYHALKKEMAKARPAVESAKLKSDTLGAQAAELRKKLVDTATRVQALEEEKGDLDSEIAQLSAREILLAADFSRDRVQVGRLLAVLERLQHDMPPILALKPDDALGAARGAMLLGASLPRIYGAAAALGTRTGNVAHNTRCN